ncbi:hypothetical protein KFE98_12930 [bacterium SCSIO 12741]|nr:hypothetical protein KFE98_12930 [bacterium SCSIO 12741]
MKLRIQGQSVRLRLKKSEVDQFANTGSCQEKLNFPDSGALSYSLIRFEGENVSAEWENQELKVLVPGEVAQKWASTERVGFRGKCKLPDGSSLDILVEKDFKCLTGEDKGDDFYDNPYLTKKAGE